MHRDLKVTTDVLPVFSINWREKKMLFEKTMVFSVQPVRYLTYLKFEPRVA